MGIAGGLRARLVRDNIFDVVDDGLRELGYMDEDRPHKSVTVRIDQIDEDEEAEPNLVVVTTEDVTTRDTEMGSLAGEHIWLYYVDVYAEDNVFGMSLATDIRDILQGRISTVSRRGPDIDVYDLRLNLSTPHELFTVELENIDMDKSRFYERPFQKNWWVIGFEVHDYYTTDEDVL